MYPPQKKQPNQETKNILKNKSNSILAPPLAALPATRRWRPFAAPVPPPRPLSRPRPRRLPAAASAASPCRGGRTSARRRSPSPLVAAARRRLPPTSAQGPVRFFKAVDPIGGGCEGGRKEGREGGREDAASRFETSGYVYVLVRNVGKTEIIREKAAGPIRRSMDCIVRLPLKSRLSKPLYTMSLRALASLRPRSSGARDGYCRATRN